MRKYIKPASLIIAVCMLISLCNMLCFANVTGDTATALLDDKEAVVKNMKATRGVPDGNIVGVRGGIKGWLLDPSQGAEAQSIYIDLDDSFAKEITDGTEFEITIEYYDSYNSWFTVQYDSETGTRYDNRLSYVRNSGGWLKKTYVITDAYFGNRMKDPSGNNADLCVTSNVPQRATGSAQDTMVVRSIEVRKISGKNPVRVSFESDELGNIFTTLTENKFRVKFFNRLSTSGEYQLTYYIRHENGEIVWEGKDTLSIEPSGTAEKEVEVEFGRFGLYNFGVILENETVNSEYSTVCSYSIQAEDGLKNKNYQINTHMTGSEGYTEKAAELLSKSGASGVRDCLYPWAWTYKPETGFTLPEYIKEFIAETDAVFPENNNIVNFAPANTYVMEGAAYWDIPTQKYHFDEWEKYVLETIKVTGAKKFEIWNEPNLKPQNFANTEAYMELIRRTVKVVHEYNPEYKVGICSFGNVNDKNNALVFFDNLVKHGLFEVDFDAITLHPYHRTPEGHLESIRYYDNICREHGRDDVEFWHTEYGYTTSFRGGVSQRVELNVLTRTYLALNINGLGDQFCKYEIMDQEKSNKYEDEHAWGAVHSRYETNDTGVINSAKNSFIVIAALNYLMRDAEPIGPVDLGDKDIWTAHYNKTVTDEQLLAIWSTGQNKMVTLDLGCDKVLIYDIWGNSREVYGENGRFNVGLTDQVKYIVGDFKKIEMTENLYDISDFAKEGTVNGMVTYDITAKNSQDLSVEVDLPSHLKLAEKPVFENGKATVKVILPDIAFEETYFTVYIVKNGKRVQAIDLYVTNQDVVANISFSKKLKDHNNPLNWTGIIKVTNSSSSDALRGTLDIYYPEEFKELPRLQTGTIGPGDTAEIEVNFPSLDALGIYTLGVELQLEDGRKSSKSSIVDFTAASYMEKPPTIDGKVTPGEWDSEVTLSAKDISMAKLDGWKGAEDLSFDCIIQWDEENLYYSVKVLDDIAYFDPVEKAENLIWRSDSIQFGLLYGEVTTEAVMGTANRTFEELGMGICQGKPIAYRWSSQSTHGSGKIENCEVAIDRHGNYTHFEMRVPWNEVIPPDGKAPQVGDLFGFSMLVNDNDGSGRRGWMEYASGIGSYKDSSQFTYIELIK